MESSTQPRPGSAAAEGAAGEGARPTSAAAAAEAPLAAQPTAPTSGSISGDADAGTAADGLDDGPDLEEQVEEEKKKRIEHALQVLDGIPVGQAFCTMRVAKKTGQTLRATMQQHNWTAQPPRTADGTSAPQLDLSSMLPGPAFGLPSPNFGAPAAATQPSDAVAPPTDGAALSAAGSSRPASAAQPSDTGADGSAGGQASSSSAAVPTAAAGGDEASEHPDPTKDATLDLEASLDAKLMATWHYAEATEDGGIAISFGDLANADLECERLYATMMKCVEEENEAAEEAEAAIMGQMAGDDEEGMEGDGDAALGSMLGALPTPAFELPGPAFALPAPAFAAAAAAPEPGSQLMAAPASPPLPPVTEESEHEHAATSAAADAEADDLTPSLPAPSFSVPSVPPAAKPASSEQVLTPVSECPLTEPARVSPAGPAATGPARPTTPPGAAPMSAPVSGGPASGAGAVPAPRTSLPGNMNGTARMGGGLNATARGGPLSKEAVKNLKADLARTIRSELQKSMLPVRGGLDPAAKAAAAAAPAAPAASSAGTSGQSHMEKSIRVGFVEGKIRPINIVMLVVGTRGDVQPFIGIALKLKEYGHRVRIASHKVYREFVTGFGLEFYPIGGDPKVLSEFVVKHRGIMPGLDFADALQQREQVKEILYSSWGACIKPDPENPHKPFIADAIVANPPAYGHTHCAEKLNVPLHIVFTMPWTPTKQFPNPFARIKTVIGGTNSKAREVMNWLSYFAVEDLAWLGMAGMVKDFRKNTLQLPDWESKANGSHAIYHSKVPMTYIWSPSLVDRPVDWPSYCEVVGFINVELQKLTKYTPPKELADFLAAGPPPVYIGFGSLVVDDPEKLTRCFLEAIKATGLRAIIQKGWGGLGAGVKGTVEDVLFIGPAPHDWLFMHCSAVVHHGGAGTTACGLYCGKPTFIVPFFGDQPFWGAACHKAEVGPAPVPIDDLNTPKIIDALKTLVMPSSQRAARQMQERMLAENGIEGTVDHLHRTIYGALLAGKTFQWMKKGPSKNLLATALEEGPESSAGSSIVGTGVSGFFKSFFGRSPSSAVTPKSAPSKANTARSLGSDSGADGSAAPASANQSAGQMRVSTSSANGSAFSFSVNVNASREAPTPSPGSALTPKPLGAGAGPAAGMGRLPSGKLVSEAGVGALPPQSVARAAPAPVAVDGGARKGGFFSFLGC